MNTIENEDDIKNVFGETEFYKCEIEELNLYKYSECDKNPRHENFIAADRFSLLDLPEIYREQNIFDFIKIVSYLTVRIALAQISEDRPDYVPDTQIPYTCSEYRGKTKTFTGSGKVTQAYKVEIPKKCQCRECKRKGQAKNVCGEIWIDTVAHIVYDTFEAKNATCRLFFDKEICDKVIIQGVDVIRVNVRRDCCTLICETCNENVIEKLVARLKTFEKLERLIYKTVEKPLPSEKMFVIISHPHGTSKHITIGQKSNKNEHENIFSKHFYNTPTCTGSSGAPVLVFGYIGWYSGIIHAGSDRTLCSKNNVYNYSTLGFDFLFLPSLSGPSESKAIGTSSESYKISFDDDQLKKESAPSDNRCTKIPKAYVRQRTKRKHEDSIGKSPMENVKESKSNDNITIVTKREEKTLYQTVEADLHRDMKKCKKNPGHCEFIPVENFSIAHLPENILDTNILLYELIKSISDLTVQFSVHMISHDRPDFWPGTNNPYLLSDMKGKKIPRKATGFIYDIIKYTDGYKCCECDKCQVSDAPSKIWFEIIVFAAAHVICDDTEAKDTTVQLFYDREDSDLIIIKDKVRTIKVFIEDDVCVLKCITCDKIIADKLEHTIEHVKHLKTDIYRKNYHARTDLDNLFVIISHPHGCSKHVSVGRCKDVITVGKLREKFSYTTCTCPGSSGAFVYNLKSKQISLHSGSLKNKTQLSNTCFTEL